VTSPILMFLSGDGHDAHGLHITDYFDMDDSWWERNHDHIQWAFPLPEPSRAQPQSPVATEPDYDAIAASPLLKARLLTMLGRYIMFLQRTVRWRNPRDHNHLRITRVIRCLCRSGLNDVAFDFCEFVKDQVGATVGKQTCWYWDEALKRNPAWLK